MNTLELRKNERDEIVASVRSEAERDISAVIDDPQSHILAVAQLAGIQITITAPSQHPLGPQGTPAGDASGEVVESTAEEVE